jgi:hypothetical protein
MITEQFTLKNVQRFFLLWKNRAPTGKSVGSNSVKRQNRRIHPSEHSNKKCHLNHEIFIMLHFTFGNEKDIIFFLFFNCK